LRKEISARYAARTIFTRFIALATPGGRRSAPSEQIDLVTAPLNYRIWRPE
jgi:hypothetical protein